jgi:hypothetical protein
MHCMIWYIGMCSITAMNLLYRLHTMIKSVCMGFGSNGFVTKAQSFTMDGRYKMDIITWCGPPEVGLDCVTNVMYCNVQWLWHRRCILVPRDSANPAKKG